MEFVAVLSRPVALPTPDVPFSPSAVPLHSGAPLTKVAGTPAHTGLTDTVNEALGRAFTVTAAVVTPLQPVVVLVPVTVYVVVIVGEAVGVALIVDDSPDAGTQV